MGSGRLPAARVSRELWGGTLEQQPRHATHAGAQVRALHRHMARMDQVRPAVLGPLLLHVRSSRVRGSTTLVPPRSRTLLPRHHLLLPLAAEEDDSPEARLAAKMKQQRLAEEGDRELFKDLVGGV